MPFCRRISGAAFAAVVNCRSKHGLAQIRQGEVIGMTNRSAALFQFHPSLLPCVDVDVRMTARWILGRTGALRAGHPRRPRPPMHFTARQTNSLTPFIAWSFGGSSSLYVIVECRNAPPATSWRMRPCHVMSTARPPTVRNAGCGRCPIT